MTGYQPRRPMLNKPGIQWNVTTENPREGLDHIIRELEREYSPILQESTYELYIPEDRYCDQGKPIIIGLNKDGKSFGNIRIIYRNPTTDFSTSENVEAQEYSVFFNVNGDDKKGYVEANKFLPNHLKFSVPSNQGNLFTRVIDEIPIYLKLKLSTEFRKLFDEENCTPDEETAFEISERISLRLDNMSDRELKYLSTRFTPEQLGKYHVSN